MPAPALIHEMEQKSGVSWDQAQAALARVFIGDVGQRYENEYNQTITVKAAAGAPPILLLAKRRACLHRTVGESLSPEATTNKDKNTQEAKKTIPLPKTVAEAEEQLQRFQATYPHQDPPVRDSVAFHCLKSGGSLLDEAWYGDKQSEAQAWVTEEAYIHTSALSTQFSW